MFGSEVLDVAIGLVFIYLVLSLICSAACELIESVLKKRALLLSRGLQELLSDPTGAGIVREVYNHPLVASLFRGKYEPGRKSNLPSYIPPQNFAIALMDIVGLCGPRANVAATAIYSTVPSPSILIAPVTPEWMRTTIQSNLPSSPDVSEALLALAHAAGYDPAALQKHIEAWYSSTMDRVSGWFKQHTNLVILAVGLILSLAINADTITIANSLATDKALRNTLVSAATEASKNPQQLNDSAGGNNFQTYVRQIRGAGLPLGWAVSTADLRHVPETPGEWSFKFIGLILTALAVSLGAPFWFDTLNQIMALRSTVKPRNAASPDDEKS